MAKRLLPSCSTLCYDSLLTPRKQFQLMGHNHFVCVNSQNFIKNYSSDSSANLSKQSKINYKKIQSPISTHKKAGKSTPNSASITNTSYNISNKNYSMFTESKQKLATQSIHSQSMQNPSTTFFVDPLIIAQNSVASAVDDENKYKKASSINSLNTTSNVGYKNKKKPDQSESRERLNQIRYFYTDLEIDRAIEKPLIRLNPMAMMYMGVSDDNSHLLKSANYLRNEIPIR